MSENLETTASAETESANDNDVVDSVAAVPAEETKAEELQAKEDSGKSLTKKEEKQLKEYKLKINGREKVIKFDPFNDDEVLSHLQKSESSTEKFQEASHIRNAAIQFIEELKKNPRKVLSDPNIGVDLKKFAAEIMDDELKEMEKSPEQREKDKLEKELNELKAKYEEERKSAEQKEQERLKAQYEQQFTTDIMAALDVGGLPKTQRTIKHMAEMMILATQEGYDLSFQDIAPYVKNSTVSDFKQIVDSLTDDQLEDFMGKEVLSRIRKKSIAKAKAAAAVPSVNSVVNTGQSSKGKEEAKSAPKLTYKQFLKA